MWVVYIYLYLFKIDTGIGLASCIMLLGMGVKYRIISSRQHKEVVLIKSFDLSSEPSECVLPPFATEERHLDVKDAEYIVDMFFQRYPVDIEG